ncbi:hypothetical protein B0H10DRAFT_2239399 [Mycena sp. CBHHK59/15]|nr:hypothetical protein B0H10DRAFT_2239399 [Mycena sp. CBHHK59/15]
MLRSHLPVHLTKGHGANNKTSKAPAKEEDQEKSSSTRANVPPVAGPSTQTQRRGAITALPKSADPALRQGLVEAHLKLSDYYTKFDQSRYYLWASLLDPGISYERLKADFEDDKDSPVILESAKSI